jgi:AcrR family transcriptional regulator
MKRTKEEAEKTRESLLDAALTVFSARGYAAAGLQEIAEEAGVTRGAIYHHFGSKAELYITLLNETSAAGGRATEQAIAEGGTFTDVFRRILVYTFALLEDDHRVRDAMELYMFKTGSDPDLAGINQTRKAEAALFTQQIAGFVQQAIDAGEFKTELNPEDVARAFMAYQNGMINLWLTDRDAFSIKAHGESLAAVFMEGLVK